MKENGGEFHFVTVRTDYGDRIEGIKNSLQNNPSAWPEGAIIAYVISNASDDRGIAMVIKKQIKIAVPSTILTIGAKMSSGH